MTGTQILLLDRCIQNLDKALVPCTDDGAGCLCVGCRTLVEDTLEKLRGIEKIMLDREGK